MSTRTCFHEGDMSQCRLHALSGGWQIGSVMCSCCLDLSNFAWPFSSSTLYLKWSCFSQRSSELELDRSAGLPQVSKEIWMNGCEGVDLPWNLPAGCTFLEPLHGRFAPWPPTRCPALSSAVYRHRLQWSFNSMEQRNLRRKINDWFWVEFEVC